MALSHSVYSAVWPQYTISQHKTQLNRIKDETDFINGLNILGSDKIKCKLG